MRYQRLDLNLLTALKLLLTERSVTRAGDALHVSQSAMSGILSRLREYFDDPLIVQVGRKMELTPLGESLIGKVSDALLMIDATLGTKPEFDPAASRRQFSIVASDYVISTLLVDVLRDIQRQAPHLKITLRQPSAAAYEGLELGEVDLTIAPTWPAEAALSSCELFADSYSVVVDRNDRRIGESLSLERYLALPHVAFESAGSPLFETWLLKNHGDLRRVEVTVAAFHLLPRLVVGTGRLATLHNRQALAACAVLPLRRVRLDFELPAFAEHLLWHRYRDHDPGIMWLRERILEGARALPSLQA